MARAVACALWFDSPLLFPQIIDCKLCLQFVLYKIQCVKIGSCNSSGTVTTDTATLKISLFLSSELGEIPTLKTLQVFGIIPDGTLQLLKEALPPLQINCSHFTTIARPTIGNKKNQEIWGIKCRLSLEKPSCL